MASESSEIVTGGVIGSAAVAAIYAIGRYIRGRITGADESKDRRIEQLERKEQQQIDELRTKVERLSADLQSLHSHVMLLEGFRTAVLMLANTGSTCISPEVIIRLSQDVDAKIKEMEE
jgi:hypothetical protein